LYSLSRVSKRSYFLYVLCRVTHPASLLRCVRRRVDLFPNFISNSIPHTAAPGILLGDHQRMYHCSKSGSSNRVQIQLLTARIEDSKGGPPEMICLEADIHRKTCGRRGCPNCQTLISFLRVTTGGFASFPWHRCRRRRPQRIRSQRRELAPRICNNQSKENLKFHRE